MDLVFASANTHKIAEIKAVLPPHFNLLSLKDIGLLDEIPEPGTTIKENSLLKARYVQAFLKSKGQSLPVFADDSGLEVEALNGAPGVYSARYAGEPKNDEANNKKLLINLSKQTKRQARFITVITLLLSDEVFYFEGEVKGTIAYEARGNQGFGYDPLFIPQNYRSTFAELGAEIKNNISHRARAVRLLQSFLEKYTISASEK